MLKEDMSRIHRWFYQYCRSFDSGDANTAKNMALKEEHTHRVCADILEIGGREGLGAEELLTAEAIAMLHDVGRFEQYRKYGTFRDTDSIDHAELGALIVAENDVLSGLSPDENRIITVAVRHHNAFAIPDSLSGDARLFLKLVRDADKLDIWRVFIEFFAQPPEARASAAGLGLPDNPECSPNVLEQIERGTMVRLSTVQTLNDFKLMQLSWIYDLNFPGSMALVSERGCIDQLAWTLPRDRRVEGAVQTVRGFVKNRLKSVNK